MTWDLYISPNRGETVAYVLAITPAVKAYAVFYQPDGTWYSTVSVGRRRVTNHVKSPTEEQAKARAIEQVREFQRGIAEALAALEGSVPMPKIVCLCGSTRFWRTFQEVALKETLAGNIVLSIGAASGTDDEHFGNLSREEYDAVKERLDQLHLRKIELADEVIVLSVEGYIGDSTRREVAHAQNLRKPIRWYI